MSIDIASFAITKGLETLLLLLLPLMTIPMVFGLLISTIQSATQIQEQLVSFFIKLLIIIILLYFGFEPGMNLLASYFQDVIRLIPEYIKGI